MRLAVSHLGGDAYVAATAFRIGRRFAGKVKIRRGNHLETITL